MKFNKLLFYFLALPFIINAQLAPIPSSGDKNFNNNISQMPMNDDFLSPILDANKWTLAPDWGYCNNTFSSSLITINDAEQTDNGGVGVMRLKFQMIYSNGAYSYKTGGVTTGKNAGAPNETGYNYPYGFYEINAKLPTGHGLWPAFWLYNEKGNSPYCVGGVDKEEIDILENPDMHSNTHPEWNVDQYRGYNWWYTLPQIPCSLYTASSNAGTHGYPTEVLLPGISTSSTYHKYAVEWFHNADNKGILVYYFDGIPQVEAMYSDVVPDDNHMQIMLTNQVNWEINPYDAYINQTLSSSFCIDYVRAYELKKDCQTTPVTLNNMTEYSNYSYSMKQSITFNTNCNILIPNGSKETFRASNEIIMKDGFAVDAGAGYTAIVHDCPPPRTP